MTAPVAGIFVGGRSKRMAGRAKGLLRAPDGRTLVERSHQILRSIGAKVVLVGKPIGVEDYDPLGLEIIVDEPPGIGPLGGIVALLRHASTSLVVALACDMPFVSAALLERLFSSSKGAPVLAPRRSNLWEPLCARYDSAHVLPLAVAQVQSRDYSLQQLLDRGGAVELSVSAEEADELRDWDCPADMEGLASAD